MNSFLNFLVCQEKTRYAIGDNNQEKNIVIISK